MQIAVFPIKTGLSRSPPPSRPNCRSPMTAIFPNDSLRKDRASALERLPPPLKVVPSDPPRPPHPAALPCLPVQHPRQCPQRTRRGGHRWMDGERGGRRHPAPCVDCGGSCGPLSVAEVGRASSSTSTGDYNPRAAPHGPDRRPLDRRATASFHPRRRAGRTASASGRGQGAGSREGDGGDSEQATASALAASGRRGRASGRPRRRRPHHPPPQDGRGTAATTATAPGSILPRAGATVCPR